MAKSACKCKATECEECPEWIFTFADLVMLMMGFFVILWVLKPAPGKENTPEADAEWIKIAAQIREAFGRVPDPKSTDPIDIEILKRKLAHFDPQKDKGLGAETKIRPEGAEGDHREVEMIRPGKQAAVGGKVLFNAGDDAITPEGANVLDQVIKQIKGYRLITIIKGNTSLDDFPDGVDSEKQWDLSTRRANAVRRYLMAHGVSEDVLRVQGSSHFEAVTQHQYTPDSQRLNRRVEVEVTSTRVDQRQDPPDPAKPVSQENPAPNSTQTAAPSSH